MQAGFHVQSEQLLGHLFYMRKIKKIFFGKNVVYSVTSLNCSVHCMAVSVNFPIVLHDGEY